MNIIVSHLSTCQHVVLLQNIQLFCLSSVSSDVVPRSSRSSGGFLHFPHDSYGRNDGSSYGSFPTRSQQLVVT
ncbi:Uncharacterized protein APZ42_014968 [Daphnia magna]|uniref:Uncharacterized protein n=1 Tax=Daphnia magna TaxID=35525 RepID=A0A162P2L5_9CRUS|nr:Uncharacterized protein APZ42_014968 [Daphnia magna]